MLRIMLLFLLCGYVLLFGQTVSIELPPRVESFDVAVSSNSLTMPWFQEFTCPTNKVETEMYPSCSSSKCLRYVQDDFLPPSEVETLLGMMKKGMLSSNTTLNHGGPTILDVNSGYMKDADGLVNIYQPHRGDGPISFTSEEYRVYKGLFDKIIARIKQVFEITELYFTAPTFVARITGKEEWVPLEPHDEYYHAHVDQANTGHYFYSGLVYLSDYGEDFTGGEFLFIDELSSKGASAPVMTAVLPKKGRFVTFKSGAENLHKVNKVLSGTRFTLSMWFTCDRQKEFGTFLDGEAHQRFQEQRGSQNDEL